MEILWRTYPLVHIVRFCHVVYEPGLALFKVRLSDTLSSVWLPQTVESIQASLSLSLGVPWRVWTRCHKSGDNHCQIWPEVTPLSHPEKTFRCASALESVMSYWSVWTLFSAILFIVYACPLPGQLSTLFLSSIFPKHLQRNRSRYCRAAKCSTFDHVHSAGLLHRANEAVVRWLSASMGMWPSCSASVATMPIPSTAPLSAASNGCRTYRFWRTWVVITSGEIMVKECWQNLLFHVLQHSKFPSAVIKTTGQMLGHVAGERDWGKVDLQASNPARLSIWDSALMH